jgi:hypothetical protein
MTGDVILATGTSKNPTFLEQEVRGSLQQWKFLQDPYFEKDKDGNIVNKKDCL